MLFHITLQNITKFNLLMSKKDSTIGWAIILNNKKSILIDPTDELREYCKTDEITEFFSNICLKQPRIYKIDTIKINQGCYRQEPYIYLSEGLTGLLFTMGLDKYAKIITKLNPTYIFTRDGQVLRQGEAYLSALLK